MRIESMTGAEWLTWAEMGGGERDDVQEAIGFVLASVGEEHFHEGGGFMRALLDAMWRADMANLERLALGFPQIVGAFKAFKDVQGGRVRLLALARQPRAFGEWLI